MPANYWPIQYLSIPEVAGRAGRQSIVRPAPLPSYLMIGELMRAERKKRGFTQAQLAVALELPQSAIAEIEGARRKVAMMEFIMWMRAIGSDPDRVFRTLVLDDQENS